MIESARSAFVMRALADVIEPQHKKRRGIRRFKEMRGIREAVQKCSF